MRGIKFTTVTPSGHCTPIRDFIHCVDCPFYDYDHLHCNYLGESVYNRETDQVEKPEKCNVIAIQVYVK